MSRPRSEPERWGRTSSAPVVDRAVERLELVAHDLIERRRFGAVALIADAALAGMAGRKAPCEGLEDRRAIRAHAPFAGFSASPCGATSWQTPLSRRRRAQRA